jgi:hypothetical protein
MMPKAIKKYQAIRSALIAKGTNLKRWAEDNEYPVTTVYGAAKGERSGIVSTKIRKRLHDFVTQN